MRGMRVAMAMREGDSTVRMLPPIPTLERVQTATIAIIKIVMPA